MDVFIIFGQRVESYEGQHAPEALICVDEYTLEDNGKALERAIKDSQSAYGDVMEVIKPIRVSVDQEKIREILLSTPVVPGTIEK